MKYLFLLLFLASSAHAEEKVELHAGEKAIFAEVASTPAARRHGLMAREALEENGGMLFVFPSPRIIAMWMKDTSLPLSVAFVDEKGKIVNIEEMSPRSEHIHLSRKSAKYALEMNRDWFKSHKVKEGDRIDGLEGLSAAE